MRDKFELTRRDFVGGVATAGGLVATGGLLGGLDTPRRPC